MHKQRGPTLRHSFSIASTSHAAGAFHFTNIFIFVRSSFDVLATGSLCGQQKQPRHGHQHTHTDCQAFVSGPRSRATANEFKMKLTRQCASAINQFHSIKFSAAEIERRQQPIGRIQNSTFKMAHRVRFDVRSVFAQTSDVLSSKFENQRKKRTKTTMPDGKNRYLCSKKSLLYSVQHSRSMAFSPCGIAYRARASHSRSIERPKLISIFSTVINQFNLAFEFSVCVASDCGCHCCHVLLHASSVSVSVECWFRFVSFGGFVLRPKAHRCRFYSGAARALSTHGVKWNSNYGKPIKNCLSWPRLAVSCVCGRHRRLRSLRDGAIHIECTTAVADIDNKADLHAFCDHKRTRQH